MERYEAKPQSLSDFVRRGCGRRWDFMNATKLKLTGRNSPRDGDGLPYKVSRDHQHLNKDLFGGLGVLVHRSGTNGPFTSWGASRAPSSRPRNNSKQREFVLEEIQEGDAMTRSVEELRRKSERNRAQLATTVDRVREQITDTAEDIRHKVSPQHIKSEVSDFISTKTSSWVNSLKQHARENPMQAIAAGTAIAVPILRLARGFPLPLLMIGAGLALSSKTVRERAAEAAAPAADKASEMMGDAMERAQSLQGDVREAVSSARSQATSLANKAQDAAAGVADDIGNRAAQAAGTVTEN